ncbi:hypothetical protein PoB_004229800 [Plakobranchus ocellatus]|uniref:Uncharacterized protein n=1 Tax=Plakobranchus ocellatus TaxID=259542 RepID=A0AAV4BAE9_9GAST|nr:hypothetical protein PoB_004229800 [Plakobranchus ocellatus]
MYIVVTIEGYSDFTSTSFVDILEHDTKYNEQINELCNKPGAVTRETCREILTGHSFFLGRFPDIPKPGAAVLSSGGFSPCLTYRQRHTGATAPHDHI